jgi:predicted O-methyltransferase YrrM
MTRPSLAVLKQAGQRLWQRVGFASPTPSSHHMAGAESIRAEDIVRMHVDDRQPAARSIAAHIEFLLPTCSLDDILPGADRADVCMLPRLIRTHLWAMPEHELLTLGAIIRMIHPARVIEFGTFHGGSTLVMAANMADGGRIVTFDLDPAARDTHEHGLGTGLMDFDLGCLFRGTRYAPMIEQRYGNTLHVDDHDLAEGADLVFIDADHTYAFAKRDTATALTCVRPGGWIVWHDYTWEPEHSECAGVTRTVNEFFEQHGECWHIAGTRFAMHRRPAAHATTPAPAAQTECRPVPLHV